MRLLFLLLFLATSLIGKPTAEQLEFFEAKIRPVLAQECYECHNSHGKKKGGLILDFRDGVLKGGDLGPAIIPGKPGESLLIEAIKHLNEDLQMPKAGVKLEAEAISDFEKWIAMGAPDPRDKPPSKESLGDDANWAATMERRKKWWSFQAITKPKIPKGEMHPVDAFVREKLKNSGLNPNDSADKKVIARRLTFALTGLPPTQKQLSKETDALVEELLASPHFGERWARHWMDWIRYAESHGSEGDPKIENAHLYRNYLIRALNEDIPYDQLIREHVAGDLLEQPRVKGGINESLIATAHWRMVFHGFAPTDALDEKVRFTDDMVNVFSKTFLGLTVSCARCHNHKFDAISQADYYAMFGVLGSARPGRKPIEVPEVLNKNRRELTTLKTKIRDAVAQEWIEGKEQIRKALLASNPKEADLAFWSEVKKSGENLGKFWESKRKQQNKAAKSSEVFRSWDFSDEKDYHDWFRYGTGLATAPIKAGEFSVSEKGARPIESIFPSGVLTNSISKKHGGRFTSPDFPIGKNASVLLLGKGVGSSLRYVVHNYPRKGTVYPVRNLTNTWQWHQLGLSYWDGDVAHIEVATAMDAPLLTTNNPRAWFAIRRAVVLQDQQNIDKNLGEELQPIFASQKTPGSLEEAADLIVSVLVDSIQAWRQGKLSDAQALLLDSTLKLMPKASGNTAALIEQYRKLEGEIPIAKRIPTLAEWRGIDQPLYDRGDHKKPGDPVPRRFLEAIDPTAYDTTLSGRKQLANDLLREDNPFVARVIVNRIWHHLFGKGLVRTPDNFGRLGEKPTHPELLDHLAHRFRREDKWSIKSLIRFLVSSETYRASSQPSPLAVQTDPDNRMLSHFRVNRLEAEIIRDTLLSVAGKLDDTMYGNSGGGNRRGVYVSVIRNRLDPFLSEFDAPTPFGGKGARDVTNVPAQSLTMLNDPFVIDAARSFARQSKSMKDPAERVTTMWKSALGREPNSKELTAAVTFVTGGDAHTAELVEKQTTQKSKLEKQKAERESILAPIRAKLQKVVDKKNEDGGAKPVDLKPISFWDFEGDARDRIGSMHGKTMGNARIQEGALVLNGGCVLTEPMSQTLKAKTLEVLVQLSDLNQRGGGAMTVQTLDGNLFDSIVFAERNQAAWMAGSNHFKRTNDFGGIGESEADKQPVRIAIVYREDGTIAGYREGKPYGKPYKKPGPIAFKKGNAQVAFGLRHGRGPSAQRALKGHILEARLFDRALTEDEIRNAAGGKHFVTQTMIEEAMTESQKKMVRALSDGIEQLEKQIQEAPQISPGSKWDDLALSIFNLKEFIYIR